MKPGFSEEGKAEDLAEQYGYKTVEGLMEDFSCESLAPAICINPGCSYTTDMEPDQRAGWCEVCEENTVKSVFVLMGVM